MIYKIKLDGKVLYYPGDRQAAVINPELDLQTGYAGELTLKVPPLNPLYGEIHNRKSMVSVYRGNTEIFYGEVRTREKDRFKNQPVKATGALSFLADSILPQQEWHDISPRDLLDAWLQLHNNQVEDRKKIYTGVVTIHDSNDSLYRITDRENTLEAIRDKLVDRLGGYLRLRHENDKLYLDWLTIQEYGKYCEQPIQFGENLMDYSETMTADDVITALIPLGAAIEQETDENASEFERLEKNVDITSVNDGKDYIYSKEAVENFGWVWRTEKWDDVSVPANLLKKATEFLTSNQYESLVISLTAVDLSLFGQDYDSFDIGDRVLCNAIPYGMKKVLPVMEMKIPLQQPDQAQLTLGENLQQSFTDQTSGTFTQIRQEATDAGRVQTEWMKSAIDNLTKQMTGAKGGYKLTEFDENGLWLRDLYMDAPDKNQATNILQINKNGIGGSHNGYAGPYTVGMTLDGTILGERILAGSIKTEALSTECKNYIETKISDGDSENKKAILKEVTTSIEAMDGKITLSVSSLEQQLKRKSGNWYGNYEPTSGNNPASAWTTDELRQEHERDLFFNTTTGYAYQYQKNDSNEYGWVRVKDKDIEAAQSTAESALSKIEVQEGLITAEVSRAKGEEEKLRSAITLTETNILSTVSKTYTTQEMANKLYANAVQEGQDAADQAEKNAKDDTDTKLKNYSTTVEMNSAINQAADSISLEVSKKYATTGQLEEKYTDAVKAGKTAADLAESNATKAGQTAAANAEANATKAGQDAADQAEKNAKADTDTKLLNYSTTLEMNSAIKQAADSISLEVSKTYTTTVQVEEKYKDAVKAGQTAAVNAETNATKAGQTAADQAEKNAKADTDTKLKSYSTTEQMNTAIKLAVDNITLEVKTVRQAVSEKNGNFYGSKIPTTSNEPASAWTTDDLKSLHVGDIYYDITTGYAYRYTYKTPGLAEGSITSEVSRAKNAESGLSSRITQTETSISSNPEYVDYHYSDSPNEALGLRPMGESINPDGTISPFMIHGKYGAGDIDGVPYSSAGLILANGSQKGGKPVSHTGLIAYMRKKGSMYVGTTNWDLFYKQLMMIILYATTNSRSVMSGCNSYTSQEMATVAETGVTRVILPKAKANNYIVGSYVSVGDIGSNTNKDRYYAYMHNLAYDVKILKIEPVDDTNSAIYLDTEPFNTTLTTCISTMPWRTGSTDSVLGSDGSPFSNTDNKNPFKIQGIETGYGAYEVLSNVFMDIVTDEDGTPKRDVYICMDASLLTTDMNAAKTRYKKVAAQVTYTAASWKYISKCFVDPALGIMVPTETKAGSTTGFCNGLYTDSGTSGQREWLSLGGLYGGTVYGLWILSAGNGVGIAGWYIVSGVSPNGTRGEWKAAA